MSTYPDDLRYAIQRLGPYRREWQKKYPENSRTFNPGEWTEIQLPKDSLVDLSSFKVSGNLLGIQGSDAMSLPRHSESLIEEIQVKVNNTTIDHIQHANHLFHIKKTFGALEGADNRGVLELDDVIKPDSEQLACVGLDYDNVNDLFETTELQKKPYEPLGIVCDLWLDFSDPDDLGRDVSGRGNHASIHNNVTYNKSTDGRENTITLANTPNQVDHFVSYVNCASVLEKIRSMTTISVCCWFRTAGPYTSGTLFSISNNKFQNADWCVFQSSTSIRLLCRVADVTAYEVGSSVVVNDGRWHHFAACCTGVGNQFYVDGVLATSYSAGSAASPQGPWTVSPTHCYLGANQDNQSVPERAFAGDLADLIIFNTALSPGMIQEVIHDELGGQIHLVMGGDSAVGRALAVPSEDEVTTAGVYQFGDCNFPRAIPNVGHGVVAYYDFQNTNSGLNLFNDVSGRGVHGARWGSGVTWSSERTNSLNFVGGGSNTGIGRVELPIGPFSGLNDFTCSCWVRYTHTQLGVFFGLVRGNTSKANDWLMYTYQGRLAGTIRVDGVNVFQIMTIGTYNDNQWHHVVFTTGRQGPTFWVDGMRVNEPGWTLETLPLTVKDVNITHAILGCTRTNNSFTLPWAGRLSDVICFNRQLTQEDVDRLRLDDYGYDVWAILGQSNAVGWTTLESGVDDIYTWVDRVYQFAIDSLNVNVLTDQAIVGRLITPATHPLVFHTVWNSNRPVNSTGFWKTCFESQQALLVPFRRRILLLPLAAGGTGFSDHDWNPGDPKYDLAVRVINHAVSLNPMNTLDGILQVLGEWDSNDQNSMFQYDMARMYNGLLRDVPSMNNFVPFVAAGIKGSAAGATWVTNINTALQSFTTEGPNYQFVDVSTLTLRDTYHYIASSYRTLGTLFATALSNATASINNVISTAPNAVDGWCLKKLTGWQADSFGALSQDTGIWKTLAQRLREDFPIPPRQKYIIVPGGQPGTSLSGGQWVVGGSAFVRLVALAQAVASENTWNQFKSATWIPSQADIASMSDASYRTNLQAAAQAIAATMMPFFAVDTGRADLDDAVRDIQTDMRNFFTVGLPAPLPALSSMDRDTLRTAGDRLGQAIAYTMDQAEQEVTVSRRVGLNGVRRPVPKAEPGVNAHPFMVQHLPGFLACGRAIDTSYTGDITVRLKWANRGVMLGAYGPEDQSASYQVQDLCALVCVIHIQDEQFLNLLRMQILDTIQIPYNRYLSYHDQEFSLTSAQLFDVHTRCLNALYTIFPAPEGNYFQRSAAGVQGLHFVLDGLPYPRNWDISVYDAFPLSQRSAGKHPRLDTCKTLKDWVDREAVFSYRFSHDDALERLSGYFKPSDDPVRVQVVVQAAENDADLMRRILSIAEVTSVLHVGPMRSVHVTW